MRKGPGFTAQALDFLGGDEEDRTPDLSVANAALSQLSYVPYRQEIGFLPVLPCKVNTLAVNPARRVFSAPAS